MKITDVRIRVVDRADTKLKAVASVTFGDFIVVHDIKIIEGKDSLFIAMPSRKTNEGEYKDIAHPISNEARGEISKAVLDAYYREIKK